MQKVLNVYSDFFLFENDGNFFILDKCFSDFGYEEIREQLGKSMNDYLYGNYAQCILKVFNEVNLFLNDNHQTRDLFNLSKEDLSYLNYDYQSIEKEDEVERENSFEPVK